MTVLKNKKGFILISAYMVVSVLIILATAFSARSIGEKRVADKERDTIQALWLAEAGLDRAIAELPNTPLSGNLGTGLTYSTQTTALTSSRYLINSTGGVPGTNESDPNNAIRKVSAIVERPLNPASSGDITSAITASGDVEVRGSAEVNGTVDEEAVFDFEDVFGISKEAMRNGATYYYTDPANNITPVDHATWVDIDTATEMKITTSGWSGSGILVVDGNLNITGGHFSGIIWVIGTLSVSGNPVIDGAIFVESGTEFETTITGNPTVSFDSSAVSDAFGFIPTTSSPTIIGWKED